MKIIKRILIAILCILILFVGLSAYYVSDHYDASAECMQIIESNQSIEVLKSEDGYVFMPDTAECGIIFYPGAKIDIEAYAPLMENFAKQGILCVLLDVPLRLAFLDINAAEGIKEKYPEVKSWYLAGHSLGASMACEYAYKHADEYEGILLLAGYSAKDLSNTNLKVISIYGENDQVLSRERYKEYKKNLPSTLYEHVIQGGCHSYFGSYGMQEGDGVPTIKSEQQIGETVEYFMNQIKKGK